MNASRLTKRLSRAVTISWRDQPSRYDIEALQANIRRVGLVVRIRWSLIIVLVLYSLVAGAAYLTRMPFAELASRMFIPAIALALVVLYNTYYQLNYRRLANIAVWNNLQLALDAVVVTVLVYFSGGVTSWFWSMYALFILEAAFILPRSRDAWLHALFSIALLGAVEIADLLGALPHQQIPFADAALHADPTFVAVRWGWQAAVLLGTAAVCTLIVGEFRRELAVRHEQKIIDTQTGLFSRSYFMRAAVPEVRRAQRDGRLLHVLLIDVDDFNDFNQRFGIDAGDEMITTLASAIKDSVAVVGDLAMSTNLVARYGGEEFAVLFAEDERTGDIPTPEAAVGLAEQVRASALGAAVAGAGVTVSIGVASMPGDGTTAHELLDSADAALVCACEQGGNRVVAARDCSPVLDDYAETTEPEV